MKPTLEYHSNMKVYSMHSEESGSKCRVSLIAMKWSLNLAKLQFIHFDQVNSIYVYAFYVISVIMY